MCNKISFVYTYSTFYLLLCLLCIYRLEVAGWTWPLGRRHQILVMNLWGLIPYQLSPSVQRKLLLRTEVCCIATSSLKRMIACEPCKNLVHANKFLMLHPLCYFHYIFMTVQIMFMWTHNYFAYVFLTIWSSQIFSLFLFYLL